jgi:hypothetical protein
MTRKTKPNQFAFEVKVTIDSDDDFKLDIQHTLNITAPTLDALAVKVLTCLSNASVVNTGANSDRWYDLRDYAIEQIKAGVFDFEFGGNQTIQMELINQP